MKSGWVKTELYFSLPDSVIVFQSDYWCLGEWMGLMTHTVALSDVIEHQPDGIFEAIHEDAIKAYLQMERDNE